MFYALSAGFHITSFEENIVLLQAKVNDEVNKPSGTFAVAIQIYAIKIIRN